MIVEIYHTGLKVAEVDAGSKSVEDALDFAWERTNNIGGSWSMGPVIDGQDNYDYSDKVTVLVPLMFANGRTYGLRSSSVGDIFVIDGKGFKVAGCGFDPID